MITPYIQTHHTRDCSRIVDQIRVQGYNPVVSIDRSNHYQKAKKHPERYLGVARNQLNIIGHNTPNRWKIVFHDDMIITPEFFKQARHILAHAPTAVINFFHPTIDLYRDAVEAGHNVVASYGRHWYPAMAFPNSLSRSYISWCKKYVVMGCLPEDEMLNNFFMYKRQYSYSVIPSLAQHDLETKSVFKNAKKLKAGGRMNLRNSFTYNNGMDVFSIDWTEAFKTPHIDKKPRPVRRKCLPDLPKRKK